MQAGSWAARDGEYFIDRLRTATDEGWNYSSRSTWRWTVPGYAMASWERGYGDFDLVPDFETVRRHPMAGGHCARAGATSRGTTRSPVKASPRQVLRGRIERARKLGFEPMFGSELEFYLLRRRSRRRTPRATTT